MVSSIEISLNFLSCLANREASNAHIQINNKNMTGQSGLSTPSAQLRSSEGQRAGNG